MSDIITGRASEGSIDQDQELEEAVGEAESQNGTAGSAGEDDGPHQSVVSGRPVFCLVCSMATTGPEDSVFIQPCRCGYWLHDQCLINVTLQFEENHPNTSALGCKICRRAYNISPGKSSLMRYAVKFSSTWYQSFSYFSVETLFELMADVTFIKIGSLVFKKIYGPGEAAHFISSMTPLRAIFACQFIPVATIFITNIPWEREFLELLRKCSGLPLVGGLFPTEYREVEDIYKDGSSFFQNLVGGLLLPLYAVAASKLFASCVRDPFHQFLLGGATVVLFKGVCKMYYKHQKYVRYCTFTVVDLVTPER